MHYTNSKKHFFIIITHFKILWRRSDIIFKLPGNGQENSGVCVFWNGFIHPNVIYSIPNLGIWRQTVFYFNLWCTCKSLLSTFWMEIGIKGKEKVLSTLKRNAMQSFQLPKSKLKGSKAGGTKPFCSHLKGEIAFWENQRYVKFNNLTYDDSFCNFLWFRWYFYKYSYINTNEDMFNHIVFEMVECPFPHFKLTATRQSTACANGPWLVLLTYCRPAAETCQLFTSIQYITVFPSQPGVSQSISC